MGRVRFPLIDTITGKVSPAVIPDLSADYVPGGSTPPDHTVSLVWVDTSALPPTLRYWDGSAWTAFSGGGGSTSGFTVTDNGNGTYAVTATGTATLTDLGNGLISLTGGTVTDLGNGLISVS